MVMWFSPGFARQQGLDLDCVRHVAGEPARHDNLFPTILGMFRVRTRVYAPEPDLLRHCAYARRPRHWRHRLRNTFHPLACGPCLLSGDVPTPSLFSFGAVSSFPPPPSPSFLPSSFLPP